MRYGRRGPVVGAEDMFYKLSVEQVPYNQGQEGNSKRNGNF